MRSILFEEVFQEKFNEYFKNCFVPHASSSTPSITKRQGTDLLGDKSFKE